MECVIFIGIQATGKSSFYQERFFRTHIRINLDMLRTRHREKILIEACLSAKQPFVIDNTNATREARANYIQQAHAAGFKVVGYYFQSVARDALERNARREGIQRVPDVAVLATSKKLELPHVEEGFSDLYYVKMIEPAGFTVEGWQDE